MTRQSIGPGLRLWWGRLAGYPGGKWLFSRLLGRYVPYSGSIGADIRALEPGYCQAMLRDRRRVRNHLHSIHAMALANLGELVTGLALMNSLPDNTRGILTGFSIDYLKKARGRLRAECRCAVPADHSEQTFELDGAIRDTDGEVVATVQARWLIGPEPVA
jgi:acyl-coenzyme A thioesterase PaaI-like protein